MEAVARTKNFPISPRKVRLVADLVRGKEVSKALNILKFTPNKSAAVIEKLLFAVVANWQNKYEDANLEEADLYIKEIYVNQGRTLKRLQPAPQGRAHRIRKRSHHLTLVIDNKNQLAEEKKETKKTDKEK